MRLSVVSVINLQSAWLNEIEVFILINFTGKISGDVKIQFYEMEIKKTLYVIKNLGFGKSTLYLVLYPLRFFRGAIKKLDGLHDEMRWDKLLHKHLSKFSAQKSNHLRSKNKAEVHSIIKTFSTPINFDWLYLYKKLSGAERKNIIPDNIFFREIEPILNKNRASFYEDKNSYGILLDSFKQPETILRFMNDNFYDSSYNQLSTEDAFEAIKDREDPWIIKPSIETGGGKKIYIGKFKQGYIIIDNMKLKLNELTFIYKRGFIIQNKLGQCEELEEFHPASLNTFRVITLRLNGDIKYLSCIVKFGVNNNPVDNSDTGAVWCGMNADGSMNANGLTYDFNRISKHPNSGKSFSNVKFTFFNDVVEFAKNMHKRLIHLDIVSWDIAVNINKKPVLIEFNSKYQGIIGCQIENGPLFGDLTDDVMAEVVRRRNRYRA